MIKRNFLLKKAFISVVACSALMASDSNSTKLENITVSANKTQESIFDVPQSITVIDSEMLQERGILTVNDLTRHIPNMSSSFAHGGSSVFTSFRGLNPSLFTNINPVVVYMDGVAYADMYDFDPSLVDVKQIEILRGPQGTLYGKDAIGAIINIVTNTPKNELEGNVVAEYGSFNTSNTKACYRSGHKRQVFCLDQWIVL